METKQMMQIESKPQKPQRILWMCGVVIACLCGGPISGWAVEPAASAGNQSATSAPAGAGDSGQIPLKAENFVYVHENRRDPFLPFITEKATSNVNMDEIVEKGEQLTGMQIFEPGQLKLVALLVMKSKYFAMVEDSTGKGYPLTKGTKIGKRGVVVDITPNKVLIEETAETRAGKKIVTPITMVLKKEGDE